MECGTVLPALSGFDYNRVSSAKRSKHRYFSGAEQSGGGTLCRGKWLKHHESHCSRPLSPPPRSFSGNVGSRAACSFWMLRRTRCLARTPSESVWDLRPPLGFGASSSSEPSLDALQSLDVLADAVKSELEEMNAAKATGMEVDRS